MKTYYDCIPCFTRQALDAVRFASDDKTVHETVLRRVLDSLSRMDMNRTPPEMGAYIHRIIKELTGNHDPYKEAKSRFNQFALGLYPEFVRKCNQSPDRFETAVRLAIAGNIIDFGVGIDIDNDLVLRTIEETLSEEISGDVARFKRAVSSARKILYLGDNTGEIVFDRIFIETLIETEISPAQITFAVRGKPVINDITYADAEETGITEIVNVIDNGLDIPGTVLDRCSKQFQNCFNEADLIISKGQGNYETLSGVDKDIFFLLKVKCKVIAENLGLKVGTSVVHESGGYLAETKKCINI